MSLALSTLFATLSIAAAQTSPWPAHATEVETETVAEDTPILIGFAPHAVPFGAQLRMHLPAGRFGSILLGAGAAIAVFDTNGQSPIRARVEAGYDYYLGERYDSWFLGGRGTGSYWTAPPIVGGSNVGVGPVVGRRFSVGDSGATFAVAGTVQVRYYDSVTVFGDAASLNDGVQVWPGFDLEITLPNTRRR